MCAVFLYFFQSWFSNVDTCICVYVPVHAIISLYWQYLERSNTFLWFISCFVSILLTVSPAHILLHWISSVIVYNLFANKISFVCWCTCVCGVRLSALCEPHIRSVTLMWRRMVRLSLCAIQARFGNPNITNSCWMIYQYTYFFPFLCWFGAKTKWNEENFWD